MSRPAFTSRAGVAHRRLATFGGSEAPAALQASLVGCRAAPALADGARGAVTAVFARSFYVTLGGQWICLGPPGLGAGPLNLLCMPAVGMARVPEAVAPGCAVRVAGRTIRVGQALVISCSAAPTWSPAPPAECVLGDLVRGLDAFTAALPSRLPAEGLAPLLRATGAAGYPDLLLTRAATAALHVAELVRTASSEAGTAVDAGRLLPLLGLGPGLTPSGDDFLGGVLVALGLLRLDGLRARIWAVLEPAAGSRTPDLSRAHLVAAADGQGSAALHDLLQAVLTGRAAAMAERIAAVAAIGHTSGFDALAGAITVLRASAPREDYSALPFRFG